jgi:hypothetical protein
MDNNLNNFFLTANIYKGENLVKSLTVPKSLIHHTVQKYAFPGSLHTVEVLDENNNLVFNSISLGY